MAILDSWTSAARPRTTRIVTRSSHSSASDSGPSSPGDSTPPELSSPSNTDSSLSQTPSFHLLPILSLDDPRIRKIWEDPRFDSPVQSYCGSTQEWNRYTFNNTVDIPMEECGLFNDELLNPSTVSLNPCAQPFVPNFVLSNLQGPFVVGHSPHFPPKTTLPPLDFAEGLARPNLLTIEESNVAYARARGQFLPPYASNLKSERPLDPPYPPGLPHPPQKSVQQTFQRIIPGSARETPHVADRYVLMLLDALKVGCIPDFRDELLCSIVDHVSQWDLFSLRELVARIMIASFGQEEELVHPSATGSSGDYRQENLSEEDFCQVVLTLCRKFLARFGEGFVNAFSFELREAIFARFLFCFDPSNPHSLNTYSKTHGSRPSSSYVSSATALTKSIVGLHRYSFVQSISVERCIVVLLQDLPSVEHVQALEIFVVGTGIALWDPPMSALLNPTTGGPGVAHLSLAQRAKAKVQSDITAFCSELDSLGIKCDQSGCPSLLEAGESWNAEQIRAKLKDIADVVRQWEVVLLELIEAKEAMEKESETQAVVLEGESQNNDATAL